MNKKILSIISVVFICMLMLFGCGKDSKKEAFEADFMEFCDKVAEIDANIKAINPDDENAPTELLSSLDTLGDLFSKMSTMKFPQEYDYLVTLAEESGQFMNLAVENYHTAFESEVYDEESANVQLLLLAHIQIKSRPFLISFGIVRGYYLDIFRLSEYLILLRSFRRHQYNLYVHTSQYHKPYH